MHQIEQPLNVAHGVGVPSDQIIAELSIVEGPTAALIRNLVF
jgi:hypothetical protein